MITKLGTLSILMILITSVSAANGANPATATNDVDQNSKNYRVASRLGDFTRPTTFTPTKATPVNGAVSENIMTSTQRVLNKEAPFLKKGMVKPIGEEQFSAWELLSDEGGAAHAQTAPNPLTYYAAGIASSLLTQVERAIQVLDLNAEDVKVETKIFFRWSDPMTDKWAGFTDKVIANITIKSNESPEKISELKELALKAWAVGEGLANETTIDAAIVINGDSWAGQEARGGKVGSPISVDNGFTLTNTTADLVLQTVKVEKDLSVDMHNFPNPMEFSEIGIAESAHDLDRPYMHKIRAKSLTENYATWELYADDSRGYPGVDKAPSSRDYFTIGTSFCLMSQLTPNQMYFKNKGVNIDDFRVEHQFNFMQDNFMTPAMTGHLDDVVTSVIVKSEASKEAITQFATQSLRTCFAGEGIQNETEIESNIYLNGQVMK